MTLRSFFDIVVPLIMGDRWLRTGLYTVDLLGGNGLVKGGILHLFGPSKSRKSTFTILLLLAAQKAGFLRAVYSLEGGFLEHIALAVGLDFDAPEFAKDPSTKHGAFTKLLKDQRIITPGFMIDDIEFSTIESTFKEIRRLCDVCHASGISPLIVWDSITATPSKGELDADEDDAYHKGYGSRAKTIRLGMRKVYPHLVRCGGILVVVDHLMQTGLSGGSANEFFSTNQFRFQYQAAIQGPKGETGFQSVISTDKSRFAPAMSVPFAFDYETMRPIRSVDIYNAGLATGIIHQKGGGYYEIPGLPMKRKKDKPQWRGVDGWPEFYEANMETPEAVAWFEEAFQQSRRDLWDSWCRMAGKDPEEMLSKFKAARDQQAALAAMQEAEEG